MADRDIQTPARTKLLSWQAADPKRRTQGFIATQLGVTQPAVSGWLKGNSRPDSHIRKAIEVLTSGEVPELDWEVPAETEKRLEALRRIEADQAQQSAVAEEESAPRSEPKPTRAGEDDAA